MSTDDRELRAVPRDHGAPTIYFDFGPTTAGVHDGVVGISLSMLQRFADGSKIETDQVVVAHLRTSIVGLGELKRAVDGALLLAMPAQGQSDRAPAN